MPPRHPIIGYRRPTDSHWPPPPPPDESPEAALIRVESERHAKRVSDKISHNLERERHERKKGRPAVKILLVGQAESGKSTTLKNFQLQFTPRAFREDAEAWRTVIHLNLLRSVNLILDLILAATPRPGTPRSQPASPTSPALSTELRRLRLSLLPLKHIEALLSRRLCAEPYPHPHPSTTRAWPNHASPSSQSRSRSLPPPGPSAYAGPRVITVRVRSNSRWKRLACLERVGDADTRRECEELEAARQVVQACGGDMVMLWHNSDVQDMLHQSGIVLQDQSGFFLDDVLRVTAKDYVPTTDDILRARLSTIGVEEHHLVMELGPEAGQTWVIYDCGGSRSQRAVWAPFFSDVNAIIFLASIAAFDQTLEEDVSVNRLDDSLQLWRALCTNRLLSTHEVVLFLNKCDVLRDKLRAGVRFAQFFAKYDDEGGVRNDYESIAKFVGLMFGAIHKKYFPRHRRLYVHLTSVIDSRATAKVLVHVRESVLLRHLEASNLL